MANKKFTEQEMLTLRNSKYVLDVSPSIVHFSAEFKKLFWEELSKGRLPREIVSTLGIDPNILGDSRINGLKTMIGNEVKKGNGFRDLNTYAQGCNGYLSAENRIKYLEMQLAYKDQEIEFLKKIGSIVIRDSRFVNEFHILKATCKFCTRLSTFVMTFPFFPLLL